MWSQRHLLDSLLWESAVDDMGIYPKSTIRGDVETPRTEWQDGWNAAVMKMTEKHGQFTGWARSLTDECATMLLELLDADDQAVYLGTREIDGQSTITLKILLNDTFSYACADAERFEVADLPEIHRLWKAHGYYGLVAWVARKRNEEPVKEVRLDHAYLKAKADL